MSTPTRTSCSRHDRPSGPNRATPDLPGRARHVGGAPASGRRGRPWEYTVGSRYNRRITANTPFTVAGPDRRRADPADRRRSGRPSVSAPSATAPVARLRGAPCCPGRKTSTGTSAQPAHSPRTCVTDWPTNPLPTGGKRSIHGSTPVPPATRPNRTGSAGSSRLDPFEPDEAPVKHTALGRFKHEGANVIVGRSGHVAAYMGDDERFDYLYKFVSKNKMRPGRKKSDRAFNKRLLTEGSLYVGSVLGRLTDRPRSMAPESVPPTAGSTARGSGCPSW